MSAIDDIKRQISLLRVAAGRLKLEKRGEEYWACCPFHSERTASFAIKVKNGEEVFFCQGCQKGGDVITFVELIDHVSRKDAIEKLQALCADHTQWTDGAAKVAETFQSVADTKPKLKFSVEQWAKSEQALRANPAAMKWLLDARGITAETAVSLRLGYSQNCSGHLPEEAEAARNKGWVLFPRIYKGSVIAVKMRSITVKAFSQMKDMDAKALFNVETINELEPIFVTEGEFDTAIMEQCGFRAVSMPNSTTKLTPENKVALKRASCIYLAGDNNGKVGNAAMRQLQRELGENTFILLWQGAKDANEFFLKVCNRSVAVFQAKVEEHTKRARATPIEGFTSLLERLRNTGGTDAGADPNRLHFPIKQLDDMNYNPAGSVVVIYSTYTGTGKTVFVTQLMLHEAKRGEVVVAYSPELRDEQYLALVAAQTVGPRRSGGLNRNAAILQSDYEETAQILDVPTERATDMRFYVGHALPESEPEKVMDFLEQTIRVTGATRMVIDTLHRLIEKMPRESQTEAEGRVVKRLEALGIKYGTIFILIGQSNKEAEDLKEARRDSYGVLRGSRELQDVAYGIYLLHRKRKAGSDEKNQILENETQMVLMKDRGKGPGSALVKLAYRPEVSKFYLLENADSGTIPESQPSADEDSPGF